MMAKTLNAAQIQSLLGVDPESAPSFQGAITHVSGFADATPDSVVFADSGKALEAALESRAGLILTRSGEGVEDARLVIVSDPRYAFAMCAKALRAARSESDIHPAAVVHASASIGERARIGACAVIESDVTLGDDVEIGSGAKILAGSRLGHRVIIQAGAVVGATGFGYVHAAATGEHILFPQQARVVIEDDVEIGANTTIDRGALGETRIGRGTKIDNLVHIGHNCTIGRDVLIAAQVGISGSCVIEDGAVLAGQVGLGDHVSIGPGVILGGSAGVFPGKRLEGPGQMFMGVPAEPLKQYLKTMARVRRLSRAEGQGRAT
jgi:UDP-3-O-[3-hydroxymyristoyl] glucosamine N-acyltransferase